MGGVDIVIPLNLDLFKLLRCQIRPQGKEFTPGRMWGQLKVHKPNLAYRLIVDNSVKLGQPLEAFILTTLSDILASKRVYSIKNSLEVVDILSKKFTSELLVSAEHRIFSADFTSMYTNVPTKKALDLVESLWDAHNGSEVSIYSHILFGSLA